MRVKPNTWRQSRFRSINGDGGDERDAGRLLEVILSQQDRGLASHRRKPVLQVAEVHRADLVGVRAIEDRPNLQWQGI